MWYLKHFLLCIFCICGFSSSLHCANALLVCNSGNQTVEVVDSSTGTIHFSIDCPDMVPLYVVVNDTYTKAYVVGRESTLVYEIDLSSFSRGRQVTMSYPVAYILSEYLLNPIALSPDGTKLYVLTANADVATYLTIIDTNTFVAIDYNLDSFLGSSLCLSSDGSTVYVAGLDKEDGFQAAILRFSTVSLTEINRILVPNSVIVVSVASSPSDTKLYAISWTSDPEAAANFVVIDLPDGTVRSITPFSNTFPFANIVFSPNGERACLSIFNGSPSGLQMINGETDTFDGSFTPISWPIQPVFSFDGATVFVSNMIVDSAVYGYNAATRERISTFENFFYPYGLAIAELNLAAPLAPKKFIGKILSHKENKGSALLRMRWLPSDSTGIVSYQVFSRHQLIGTVSAGSSLLFRHHLYSPYLFHHHIVKKYKKRLERKYKVRAVDAAGQYSSFTRLKVVQ